MFKVKIISSDNPSIYGHVESFRISSSDTLVKYSKNGKPFDDKTVKQIEGYLNYLLFSNNIKITYELVPVVDSLIQQIVDLQVVQDFVINLYSLDSDFNKRNLYSVYVDLNFTLRGIQFKMSKSNLDIKSSDYNTIIKEYPELNCLGNYSNTILNIKEICFVDFEKFKNHLKKLVTSLLYTLNFWELTLLILKFTSFKVYNMKVQTIIETIKSDKITKIRKLRSEIKKLNDDNLKSAFNKLLIQYHSTGYKSLLFSGVTSGFYFQTISRLKYFLIDWFKYSNKELSQKYAYENVVYLRHQIKIYEFQKNKQNIYLRTLYNKVLKRHSLTNDYYQKHIMFKI